MSNQKKDRNGKYHNKRKADNKPQESQYEREERERAEKLAAREAEKQRRIEETPRLRTELDEHYKQINERLEAFMAQPDLKGRYAGQISLSDDDKLMALTDGNDSGISKWSKEDLLSYIKDSLDGWSDEAFAYATYKDGSYVRIDSENIPKRIKTTNLSGLVMDDEAGTYIWGKGVKLYNFREVGSSHIKNEVERVHSEYNDWDWIRWDFE